MKISIKITTIAILLFTIATSIYSHCQIPCGIYGDQTRFTLIREHISTIEKSMNQINELSAVPGKNMNQLVRWVSNKDEHANKLSEIITSYFLSQRIKIVEPSNSLEYARYQKMTILLHQMMVYSMKCKQTTDKNNINKLKDLINVFETIYFNKEAKEHLKEHYNN